jgi:toxin ParE1/3/4
MKLRISSEANQDLRGIGAYIARDNPRRAVSFVAELSESIREIGRRPLSFPAREDLAPGLRARLHRPYLILFRIAGDTVEIARVIHGARDVAQHL